MVARSFATDAEFDVGPGLAALLDGDRHGVGRATRLPERVSLRKGRRRSGQSWRTVAVRKDFFFTISSSAWPGRKLPESSRDRPSTVCVRSLVPKLKNSAVCAISSARTVNLSRCRRGRNLSEDRVIEASDHPRKLSPKSHAPRRGDSMPRLACGTQTVLRVSRPMHRRPEEISPSALTMTAPCATELASMTSQ